MHELLRAHVVSSLLIHQAAIVRRVWRNVQLLSVYAWNISNEVYAQRSPDAKLAITRGLSRYFWIRAFITQQGGYVCATNLLSVLLLLRHWVQFHHEMATIYIGGMSWSSGLVHHISVLMAESSECGFGSWLRPWCLCPSARHFTVIASLHRGVNGYLWGQSWLLCLISPMRRNGSNWDVYSPGSWDGFRNDLCAWWAGLIMYSALI